MKFLFVIGLFLGVSNGAQAAHVEANYCEGFVDKVAGVRSSHASTNLIYFVKTLNARLDGQIVEVGFRYRTTLRKEGATPSAWSNFVLRPFAGSADYYIFNTAYMGGISSDFGASRIEGAFYVRTDKDTNYWIRPQTGGNFVMDNAAYDYVVGRSGNPYGSGDPLKDGVPTQREDMTYYNPGRCY